MSDNRNYATTEKPRGDRPPSATASNLNQRILRAIEAAPGGFIPNQMEEPDIPLHEILGRIRALINLKIIKIEVESGTERFSLTRAGKTALDNRLLAID